MGNSSVVIGSFITTNWSAKLKAESAISRFKTKHGKFIALMLAGDFTGLLHGATEKGLVEGMPSWVDKTHSHIESNSGQILASYEANKEAAIDFQVAIKKAELLKLGKGTEGIVSDKEMKALDAALKIYRAKALPFVIAECNRKLRLVIPNNTERKASLKTATADVVAAEAEAQKEREEAEASV